MGGYGYGCIAMGTTACAGSATVVRTHRGAYRASYRLPVRRIQGATENRLGHRRTRRHIAEMAVFAMGCDKEVHGVSGTVFLKSSA